jgi:pSer/pThr/pTyr-binding forkhead associated (FHA) protein
MSDVVTISLTLVFIASLYLFLWYVARAVRSHLSPATSADPSAVLHTVAPASLAGRTHTIDRPLVIGRGPDADIRIDDPFASDLHTRLAVDSGRLTVVDLGSTNGTFVNENRIAGVVKVDRGDRIRLGETIMEVG